MHRFLLAAAVVAAGCATADSSGDVDGGAGGADALAPDVAAAGDAAQPDASATEPDGAECIPTGAEACNGVDDDCDGMTDEGFPGVGADCDVGVGACERTGTTVCLPDGSGTTCSATPGAPGTELCGTGVDEDCDGITDEGFTVGSPCTVGIGACAASGTTVCAPDALSTTCSATPGTPGAELCGNGVDDDCDTLTDEGFPTLGMSCSVGVGACLRTGSNVCSADGLSVVCNASPGTPAAESCNGIDDDCDGMTDEGFGLGSACDGADGDLCNEGTIICAPGGGTSCSDSSSTNAELCNGVDDDCNAATADGAGDPMVGGGCDGPDGDMCLEGTRSCSGGALVCSDATGTTSESCNNADDDCDGLVDETWPAKGTGCTAGVGWCAASGTWVCLADGTGLTCNAVAGSPTTEYCGDGVDHDCNGVDPSCPTNDYPAGAIDISAGGTFSADLTFAHDDHNASCYTGGGRDVFYTFTLPSAEVVYLDTFGSNFDTVLRVYAGACTALGANQLCADDACGTLQTQSAVQLGAGTYCLVVDQYSSFSTLGSLTLTFTRGGRTGTNIPAASGSYAGTTVGAANVTAPGCTFSSSAPEQAYWFTMCPADARSVTATTCSLATWDTAIYLRAGSALSADVACNDDACSLQSTLPATSISGANLYWLVIDGYGTASGSYTLSVTM